MHRWLGLLMALQITAWMASGLYFSLFPIGEIRGEHLTREPESLEAGQLAAAERPGLALAALDDHFGADWQLEDLRFVRLMGQGYWRAEGRKGDESFVRLIESDGRRVVPRLSEAQAERAARYWLSEPAELLATEWVESASPGSEIRGRQLPVWKIAVEHPESPVLYIDPWTGDLLARRTDRWRIFDFLWMLHIMDYDSRDDFNHPLLQIASALGLIVALSGIVYWTLTTRVFRRKAVTSRN